MTMTAASATATIDRITKIECRIWVIAFAPGGSTTQCSAMEAYRIAQSVLVSPLTIPL
jgi:hypothetical protein